MRPPEVRLRTPEGVVFALPLAGLFPRFTAWLVDLLVVGASMQIASLVAAIVMVWSTDFGLAVQTLLLFAFSVGYGIVCEWFWRGQTIGKRILHLRVVDARGGRLRPRQVILRNLLRVVDALPALHLVAGISALLSPYSQRLGDYVAGTIVIRTARPELPEIDGVLRVKYNSLRRHAHLAARLRQRLSPADATLGLNALLRVDSLEPEARVELFTHLADHYRRLVSFPEEDVELLADEQYVRNVVDLVFRPEIAEQRSASGTPNNEPTASGTD